MTRHKWTVVLHRGVTHGVVICSGLSRERRQPSTTKSIQHSLIGQYTAVIMRSRRRVTTRTALTWRLDTYSCAFSTQTRQCLLQMMKTSSKIQLRVTDDKYGYVIGHDYCSCFDLRDFKCLQRA
ncbi:hypothetical protein CSPX01_02507 [Colletotrichum filicis]|nr:hypothetical protein CSPX01_02507 [Colletotrichum filicis]